MGKEEPLEKGSPLPTGQSSSNNNNNGNNQSGEDETAETAAAVQQQEDSADVVDSSGTHTSTTTSTLPDNVQEMKNHVAASSVSSRNTADSSTAPDNPKASSQSLRAAGSGTLIQEEVQPGAISMPGTNEEARTVEDNIEDEETGQRAEQAAPNSGADSPMDEGNTTSAVVEPQQGTLAEDHPHASSSSSQSPPPPPENLIQAQLVPPPVHAVSVMIDEDPSAAFRATVDGIETRARNRAVKANNTTTREQSKKGAIAATIILILIIVIVVLAVLFSGNSGDDTAGDVEAVGPPPPPTIQPVAMPRPEQFDYECYSSTLDVLLAQYDELVQTTNTTSDRYIICPNTTIHVGVIANPAIGNYEYIDGDYPLWILASDTILQCGLDGHVENNCVIDGGLIQVLLQTYAPIERYRPDVEEFLTGLDLRLDNVTIRGFTFTGLLDTVGPLAGSSVIISQAGSITMEDCRWTQLTATAGLIGVHRNAYQILANVPLEQNVVTVTLRRCAFDNSVYDVPILFAINQTLHVEDCTFANWTVSALPVKFCSYAASEIGGNGIALEGGCANLLTCLGSAVCSITGSCIENVETTGSGLVYMMGGHTNNDLQNFGDGAWSSNNTNESIATSFFNDNFLDATTRERLPCEIVVGGRDGTSASCRSDITAFQASICAADFG